MADTNNLVSAAMALRASAPSAWEHFLQTMDEYSREMAQALLTSPPEALAKAQGMALSINELTQLLINAPRAYDKLQAAKLGKQQHGRQPGNFRPST